ncbi:MAG: hypothetical protein AAFY58_07985 [Planctomycetota bacterium]
MKWTQLAAAAALLGALTSCSSLRYTDPDQVETVNILFGSTDIQSFGQLAGSLLSAPNLKYVNVEDKGEDKRPVAVFGGIANETREHINTNQIFREMKPDIVNSGEMRLLAGAEDNGQSILDERVRFESESGRVAPGQAAAFGRQLGADIVIYGALSDIYKEGSRSIENVFSKRKDVYYQLNLSAVNVDTAEVLWTETAEINKQQTVSLFGRG